MANVGGRVSEDRGFTDILPGDETSIYKYKGKTFIVTYDGEIYNKNELRSELISGGNYFDTSKEDEIVLKAYTTWQESCLRKLEGVFSFGIWCVEDRKLIIARDPIGAKPMFFVVLKNGVIFADHVKTIFQIKEVTSEVTYEGIAELMTLGPSRRHNSTLFRNIGCLEAGSYLTYDLGNIRIMRYDDFTAYEVEENFESIAEVIREEVADSVIRQISDTNKVCTLLSGGLDSSIVTAIVADAKKQTGEGLETFSIDYEGNDAYFTANDFQPNSDNEWINKMISFLYTDHRVIELTNEELAEGLHEAMIARGVPGMGDIDSALLIFCRRMKKYADIGLGGECADELFGGYPWFHKSELFNSDFFPWIRSVEERSIFLSDEIKSNVNAIKLARNIYDNELRRVPVLNGESIESRRVREIGYLTYKWFLPVLLERQDKMAKKAGFKIRAPFCNFSLMKYVYNIPWEYRAYNGVEKGLLRYAFKDLLPKEVVERKKSPFPKTYNPGYRTLMMNELQHILDNPTSPILDIIDINNVRKLFESNEEANRPWFGQLMRGPQVMAFLIQVNDWLKEYRVSIV